MHHLFVKVPPKRTAKFERMVRRNRTLEHEVKVGPFEQIWNWNHPQTESIHLSLKVYTELLRDLKAFVKDRVGDAVQLNIPKLYHGGGGEDEQVGNLTQLLTSILEPLGVLSLRNTFLG